MAPHLGVRHGALLLVLPFAVVLGLAAAQGGYFSTAWGYAAVPLLGGVALALAAGDRLELDPIQIAFAAGLLAFLAWAVASLTWSEAPAETVLEVERLLIYVGGITFLLLVARRETVPHVLGATLAAISIICGFALGTRLFPDRLGVYDDTAVYRLAQPIGYWNGLAVFAVIGAILALGFAARAHTIGARAAGGALTVVLMTTMYFTFGRSAWIALGVGIVIGVAVDPRRVQLLAVLVALAAAPAAAIAVAATKKGLTHPRTALEIAAQDGHRVALWVGLLAVANAAIAVGAALIETRVAVPLLLRRGFAVAAALAACAVTIGFVVERGGPAQVVRHAYRSFEAPPHYNASNLNNRLLMFSSNGRVDLWRLAWHDFRRHPLLGAGPGTFERYFLANQPTTISTVRDAHSLYLETLAEAGIVGLALLLAFLLVPLAAIGRARREPLGPLAAAAYVAYLVHTGVDWDWELPAVTLAGLICATCLVVAARSGSGIVVATPARILGTAAVAVAVLFSVDALVGNTTVARSQSALGAGRADVAATEAARARRFISWSPLPWDALGRAQLANGDRVAARSSFRHALSMDRGSWLLWYHLSLVTTGPSRRTALNHVARLYRLSGLVPRPKGTP